MAQPDGLAELFLIEIAREGPQAKPLHAAIHRVRPEVERRLQRLHAPRRTQQFNFTHTFVLSI